MPFWITLPTSAKPASTGPPSPLSSRPPHPTTPPPHHRLTTRIAIAQDAAFSFYYPDSLEHLTHLGAELVPWSPLTDTALPDTIDGLYLGGGFPEIFGAELAANQPLRTQLKHRLQMGLPAYVECGGLMYLTEALVDLAGKTWPMVGLLPTQVRMESYLTLGYRQATANFSTPFLQRGQRVWGHEFHRSQVTSPPSRPLYALNRYQAAVPHAQEGWQIQQVHASYLHLHWVGCPDVARNFVQACERYRQRRATNTAN
jgi:cobyrinic acid a,c-diamide synthase